MVRHHGPCTSSEAVPPNSRPPEPKPHVSGDRKKSALYEAASRARKATGEDADALLLAATQSAKRFNMNRWFILKRMQKDADLAIKLKYFIEKDISTYSDPNLNCHFLKSNFDNSSAKSSVNFARKVCKSPDIISLVTIFQFRIILQNL